MRRSRLVACASPLQMPVKLGRESAAGEWMEQEIALVGQILDARGNIDLGGQAIDGTNIRDRITFEALKGVSDTVTVVDRREHAALIAHSARQRELVYGPPGRDQS